MPTPSLPQRQSLVAQTVAFLHAQIEGGAWQGWLPSERSLCELLQVSRNTLRAALAQMKQEGRIRPVHGAGNEILVTRGPAVDQRRSRDVALLAPEPIERLRPMQSLWIDEMRALLSERGLRLRVFHGHHYFAAKPGPALQKLVTRNPHGCWILMLAGETVQRWFSRARIPCIVAGSSYPGLDLPFRDLDHRAMCRHAAGVLLGLGHRRLVMLTQKSRRAGDLESEAGFLEGVKKSRHTGAEALVIYHDETIESLALAVRRIIKLQPAATALLVVHPHYYLAAASRLAQSGVKIPGEISMISRDDDPFLSFIVPVPARYVVSPHLLAKSLLRPVLDLLDGHVVTQRASLIMPEFVRGESVAAPRAGD
ncbi:substrate-binding domain-containing protein [Horticoccus sp. 23ND18S-11]|uniref:substrate-binding domain-containing protein n=1 Tax=Horticoccus sp. 23ND18S-11 TaxID=3391832 RepID=UPI0039C94372